MFVYVPARQRRVFRWATPLLVIACVAVFCWLALAAPEARYAVLARWGTVPSHLFDTHHPFSGWPWLRLFTALFMHADWLHLVGNILFLVIFGFSAERALGGQRFLLLFLLGGAFANVIGALTLSGTNAPIVGCSGAVSAVVGAYLALFPRAYLGLVLPLGLYFEFVRVPAWLMIGTWALLQLLFTLAGPSFGTVVWWAHVAGFGFGIVFAFLSRGSVMRRMRV